MLDIVDRFVPDEPFRRLATAMVAATVGLPAAIYGAFALTWPIQRWLNVAQAGSIAVLLFGLFALATAHSLVRDVSRTVEAAETTDGEGSTVDEQAVDGADDPLTTLKRRYAAGEVTDEEFERRVDRLVEVDEVESRPDTGTDDPLLETE